MVHNVIIGDRSHGEWIAALNNSEKELRFTTNLECAEHFNESDAKAELLKLQQTGFYLDLEIYFQEDGRVFLIGERDN